ncbi:MAG: preprotein translocase subunit SecG [bacterium]
MIIAILKVIHFIVSVSMILAILLQVGKSGDFGSVFGTGGSVDSLFGSRGASTFLSKATIVVAVIFMITSIALTIIPHRSIATGINVERAGVEQTVPSGGDTQGGGSTQ